MRTNKNALGEPEGGKFVPATAGSGYFFPDFFDVLFFDEELFFEPPDFLVAFFIERFSLT